MLLVIHNLPSNVGYSDIKELVQLKCNVSNIIVDNLMNEGKTKKVTVGVADDSDAAVIMRKINGLYLNGEYLHVEDARKASEQSYNAQTNNTAGQGPFGYKDSQSSSAQPQLTTSNPNYSMSYAQQTPPVFNAPMAPFMGLYCNPNIPTSYMGYGNAPQPVPPVMPQYEEMSNQQSKGKINPWNDNTMMGGNVAPVMGYNNSPQQGYGSNSFEPRRDQSAPPHNRDSKYRWERSQARSDKPNQNLNERDLRRGQDESRQPRRQDPEYSRQEYSNTSSKNNYRERDAPNNPPEFRPRFENRCGSPPRNRGNENMGFGRPRAPAPAPLMGAFANRNIDRSGDNNFKRNRVWINQATTSKKPDLGRPEPWKRQKFQQEPDTRFEPRAINTAALMPRIENREPLTEKKQNRAHTWCGQAASLIARNILMSEGIGKSHYRFLVNHVKSSVRHRLEAIRSEQGNRPMRPEELVPLFKKRFTKKNEKSLLHQAQMALKKETAEKEKALKKEKLLGTAEDKLTEDISVSLKEDEQALLDVEEGIPTEKPPQNVPPKPVQATSSVPPTKPPQPKTTLPKYPNALDKKQYKQQKREHKKAFEKGISPDLKPAMKKALDEEVEEIAKFLLAEAESPKTDADKVICDGIKASVYDDFKVALKINMSKRLTNDASMLLVRIFCPQKSLKKSSLAAFLAKYGADSLKKSDRSKMYIASCTTYEGFDTLCAMDHIKVDGVFITVKPLNIAGPPKKYRRNTGTNMKRSAKDDDNEEYNAASDDDAVVPLDDDDQDNDEDLTSDDLKTVEDAVANDNDDDKKNKSASYVKAESEKAVKSIDSNVYEWHEAAEKQTKMDDSGNVKSEINQYDVIDEVNEDDLEDY